MMTSYQQQQYQLNISNPGMIQPQTSGLIPPPNLPPEPEDVEMYSEPPAPGTEEPPMKSPRIEDVPERRLLNSMIKIGATSVTRLVLTRSLMASSQWKPPRSNKNNDAVISTKKIAQTEFLVISPAGYRGRTACRRRMTLDLIESVVQ
ncbi:hypothetical protein GWI33_011199 [Rhynchophorus ferrugineus]|uniref:Uncharacterized protein n=1 Tax=Rhynchophorus ferrugineus TaxID=354439 RepID=A0A834IBB4_RHYFE|nr:hypothetical protein GWI33_011199 [Rhynchophorus ferrugineus]